MSSKDYRLSKALSWLLRHGAESRGLKLDPAGFLTIETILQLKEFHEYTLDDIKRVVASNDKQRFCLQTNDAGKPQIRANQGHSIKISDTELLKPLVTVNDCPTQIIHGTYLRNWESIRKNGLSRMKRNHIHFASDLPRSNQVISGMRRNCEILVYLNFEKTLQSGIKLFLSENAVILSPGDPNGFIKPECFLKVLKYDRAGILTEIQL